MSTVTRRRQQLAVVDEAALALVTLAAIIGMHRLFIDGSFRGPLVAQALIAHLVVTLLRRGNVRLVPAVIITALAAFLVISWARFPETTHWLLPTGHTFSQAGDDLQAAWALFGKVRAPAPVENGFLAITAAAIWLIAFVADWAAFRVSATFEALLPATTLFIFAAALGRTGGPVASAALFAAAALLFVLLHRTSNQERMARWADFHNEQGRWSLLATGASLSGVAVVAGVIAGPMLVDAGSAALLPWRELNRQEPTRIVPSPMVSLQTQLLDQPNVELFTVTSDQPAYWRLTSLDHFDGTIWRQSYSTSSAKGRLPQAISSASPTQRVTQTFQIGQLSSVWLPAAFEPVAVDTEDKPADYDEGSSTLMVDHNVTSSNAYTYKVTSDLPRYSGDQLRTASPAVPKQIAARYLQLPTTVDPRVRALAHRLTDDKTSPWDKALALQDYLRGPDFTYDLRVGPGHSNDALSQFLFDTRRGYCEQFAGSYAVMARAVGLPTRVAIGFTWGVQDDNHRTTYRVRGNHAHAWPEVYIGQYGWVPVEPTKGRGPPDAANFLGPGVGMAEDPGGGGNNVVPTPSTTQPGGAGNNDIGSAGRRPGEGQTVESAASGGSGGNGGTGVGDVVRRATLPALGLIGAYCLLVPALLSGQRLLARRRARLPAARVRLWWQDATEQARRAGLSLPAWLTISETADRVAAGLPGTGPPVHTLAHSMEMISYAEIPPSPEEADAVGRAAGVVVAAAHRRQSWPRRILSWLDVRRLRRPHAARLVATHGPA